MEEERWKGARLPRAEAMAHLPRQVRLKRVLTRRALRRVGRKRGRAQVALLNRGAAAKTAMATASDAMHLAVEQPLDAVR